MNRTVEEGRSIITHILILITHYLNFKLRINALEVTNLFKHLLEKLSA